MSQADTQPTDRELAMLAALADGTLPPPQRSAAETRVAGSTELRALLVEQRRAVARVRALDVSAPSRLRARIESERRGRRPRARRRRAVLALLGGLAGALAAAVLVAALVLPGAITPAPSVAAAASLAERGPNAAAPGPAREQPKLLAASLDRVAFPNYRETFAWAPSGMRVDELDGRATRTVYYERQGRQIAYTIVSGPALAAPDPSRLTRRDGTALRLFRQGTATAVTWLRDGRTCVLSGAAPAKELLELAAWNGQGTVPSEPASGKNPQPATAGSIETLEDRPTPSHDRSS